MQSEELREQTVSESTMPEEGAEEREVAEAVLDGQPEPMSEPMLTNAEVAQLAGVAATSVGNWTGSGVLPFEMREIKYPDGRKRRVRLFKKSDVEEFLRKRQAGEIGGLTSVQRERRATAGGSRRSRVSPKLKSLGIDEIIANMERELIALKRLRETERRDIEQEVKARLVASIQRNH